MYKDSFSYFLGNASKASTSREAEREVIEETSSEASFQDDQDWLQTLNQKLETSKLSESSNTDSQQEADVRQTPTQSLTKSMKGTKNGGEKKAKYGNNTQIERWDFFTPTQCLQMEFRVTRVSQLRSRKLPVTEN